MRLSVALVALLALTAGAAAAPPAALRPTACWFAPPRGVTVSCDRLTVPEDRSHPGGRTISLAVAVFHSRSAHPRPDPVLFLPGGPGAGGIAVARSLSSTLIAPWLATRDFVTFDPRGTGRSQPALTCHAGEDPPTCLLRWRRAGVDLAAYQSAATADDAEALRRALGIARWNVIGVSYGTRLALTLLRMHPDHVRSAILDSTVPPQVDELATTTTNAAAAIRRLVEACAADRACRRAHPDLATTLATAVARLDRTPLDLGDGTKLTGNLLLTFVFGTLYDPAGIPYLPRAIAAAAAGRLDPLWPRVGVSLRETDSLVAGGAYWAWVCNEEAPFTTLARVEAADRLHPDLAPAFSARGAFGICRAAGSPSTPAVENRPVASAVPTLLLSGRFDPVTPTEWAQLAVRTLSRGRLVRFPTLSHRAFSGSACARRIGLAFVAAPQRPLDTGCVARMPRLRFAS